MGHNYNMDDEQRKADYERAANDSWSWILIGERLVIGAEYLHDEYENARDQMRKKSSGTLPPGAEMLAAMIFMRAISLENLLKALCVKLGISATNGAGHLTLKGHDLVMLSNMAQVTLNNEKNAVLEKLSEAIISWGRYPVPTSYKTWRPDIAGITGMQPVFSWSTVDEALYLEILNEIRELLKDPNKGQKPPPWYVK